VISGDRIDDEVYGKKRSLFHYQHQGRLGNNWSDNILFDRASDDDYFNDFSNSLSVSATSSLERPVQLQYADARQHLQIQAQAFQFICGSQPYRRLPQIKHQYNPAVPGPARFAMATELVRFQRLDSLGGKRAHNNPSLGLPSRGSAVFVIPKLSLHHSQYRFDEQNNNLGVDKSESHRANH